MSSSHEIPYQVMETQGLRGNENVAVYENSPDDPNNIYEELRVQASAKSDGREQISVWKGKKLWMKIVFAIVWIIVGTVIASAASVLFIKVINNEKTLEKSSSMLHKLSVNVNETNTKWIKEVKDMKKINKQVHEKTSEAAQAIEMKLNATESRINIALHNSSSNFHDLEEKLYKKLNETEARLNNTIDSSISKLQNLEAKLYMKLNEAESRLNNTTDSSIPKVRRDLETLKPVSSHDQTSINGVYALTTGGWNYCSCGWTISSLLVVWLTG